MFSGRKERRIEANLFQGEDALVVASTIVVNTKTLDAQLFIDTGAMRYYNIYENHIGCSFDLVLPERKALELGLREMLQPEIADGTAGVVYVMARFGLVEIKIPVTQGQECRGALEVFVARNASTSISTASVELPNCSLPSRTSMLISSASSKFSLESVPTSSKSSTSVETPSKREKTDELDIIIDLSPLIFSTVEECAILGMSGLKKLGLSAVPGLHILRKVTVRRVFR